MAIVRTRQNPFVFDLSDLQFLLQPVTFRPPTRDVAYFDPALNAGARLGATPVAGLDVEGRKISITHSCHYGSI